MQNKERIGLCSRSTKLGVYKLAWCIEKAVLVDGNLTCSEATPKDLKAVVHKEGSVPEDILSQVLNNAILSRVVPFYVH